MSDQHITCSECGGSFVFTESERQFYETKGLSGPPKRCKTCRQARKATDPGRTNGFRGGRETGGAPRGAGPSREAGGGRGGYDRPRGGESLSAGRYGSGPGGPPAAGGWGRIGGGAPRTGGKGFAGRGAPGGDGGGRGGHGFGPADGGARGFAGAPKSGYGASQPRGDRGFAGSPRGGRARPERARFGEALGRREIRTDVGPKPRPAPTEAAPPRPKKAKPERPKFDVTCIECGAAAQVPFKPLEGRDVFCQPCYRARRGLVTPAEPGVPLAPETAPDTSALDAEGTTGGAGESATRESAE